MHRREVDRATMPPGKGFRSRVAADLSSATRTRSAAGLRIATIRWAADLVADPRTVYLDTETTGLGSDAEVVDLALIGADGRVVLETLVRPSRPIPSDATAIHGISDADVAASPYWPEVFDLLGSLLDGRPVVVYNAAFDRRIIAQCCDRHRLVLPTGDWHCAMRAYADYYRAEESGARGSGWRKLTVAAARFGAAAGTHRAAADAVACRAVVVGIASTACEE